MNLTIEQPAALRAVSRVQSVIERRSTIPILSNVLLAPEGDQLRIIGTDLEMEVSELVDCAGAPGSAITVPASTLHEILRNSAVGSVGLVFDKGDPRMRVTAGRSRFSLPTLPASDLPRIGDRDFPIHFTLPSKELLRMIDSAAVAMEADIVKTYGGVRIYMVQAGSERLLRAISTNGNRLSRADVAAPEGLAEFAGMTLPPKTVRALRGLLEGDSGDAEVSVSDALIRVDAGGSYVTSKLLGSDFPDCERVVPKDRDFQARLDADALGLAVRRAMIMATDKHRSVRLTIGGDKAEVFARSADSGEGSDDLEVEYDGPAMELGFNGAYLTDALGRFAGKTVTIGLTDNKSPVLFTEDADPWTLHLLMPHRV